MSAAPDATVLRPEFPDYRTWHAMLREDRVDLAKAYLIDAAERQAVTASGFSMRVQTGIKMLREALAVAPVVASPESVEQP